MTGNSIDRRVEWNGMVITMPCGPFLELVLSGVGCTAPGTCAGEGEHWPLEGLLAGRGKAIVAGTAVDGADAVWWTKSELVAV